MRPRSAAGSSHATASTCSSTTCPDYDYASHALGPDAAHEALARADASSRRCSRRPAGPTPSSIATRSSSAPTTASRPSSGRRGSTRRGRARHRLQPRGDGLRRRSARARRGARRRAVGRRRALPRGRRGGRAPRRRRGSSRSSTSYPDGRARAAGALAQPERRRGARLGRAPAGSSATSADATTSAAAATASLAAGDSEVPMLDGRARRAAGVDHAGSRRSLLEHFGVARRPGGVTASPAGSSASSAAAASTTSASSTRWRACRASCSSRASSATPPTTTARCRSPYGQTVSQPFIVALICQSLGLAGDERVLDVGTGSGYAAAVLAELAAEVHSIERIPELAERPGAALAAAGYERVHVHVGDGSLGLPEHAPFGGDRRRRRGDAVPPALWEQLVEGGRIASPLGSAPRPAALRARTHGGGPRLLASVPGRFVPLVPGLVGNARRTPWRCPLLASTRRGRARESRRPGAAAPGTTGSSSRSSASSARPATSSTSASTRAARDRARTTGRRRRSFVVAAANNYWWNRHWTFARRDRATSRYQGLALPRRLARVPGSTSLAARVPRLARLGQDRLAGDRDRPRHAAELHREQALVVPALRASARCSRWRRSCSSRRHRPRRAGELRHDLRAVNAAPVARRRRPASTLTSDEATKIFLAHDEGRRLAHALPAEADRPPRRLRGRHWTVNVWSGDGRRDRDRQGRRRHGRRRRGVDRARRSPGGWRAGRPGAFGGTKINSYPVWLGFCAVFLLGLVDWRRPLRCGTSTS